MMVYSSSSSYLVLHPLFLDLIQSIKTPFDRSIKVTPIYIEIYSPRHLEKYFQQRHNGIQSKSSLMTNSTNGIMENQSNFSADEFNGIPQSESSTPNTTTEENQSGPMNLLSFSF